MNILPEAIVKKMVTNRKVRIAITKNRHLLFFNFYFAHYIEYPIAPFQEEMFALSEDESAKNLVIIAFRG